MSGARVGLRLGDRLGTVIGVILTGLDRLERQDKQAGSSTTPAGTSQADQQKPAGQPGSGKAGGKAGRVKDREITKDLVSDAAAFRVCRCQVCSPLEVLVQCRLLEMFGSVYFPHELLVPHVCHSQLASAD